MGTSNIRQNIATNGGDHPHACGDKGSATVPLLTITGSSPRVWGQAPTKRFIVHQIRIIPTRVGTRIKIAACRAADRDHPHACGDKKQWRDPRPSGLGSSPRVWGQDLDSEYYIWCGRIIPTRVGTRFGDYTAGLDKKDHPHACGDKYNFNPILIDTDGSSPRVWGQVTKKMVDDLKARIIPTRVGTRVCMAVDNTDDQDHPHACGDK